MGSEQHRAAVSACIIAFNEAEKIAAAIRSVDWADEVVVVDSFSTDNTAELAASLGARVVQVSFTGFGKLRNDAIATCHHDWIFSLDADERCTPAARDEMLAILCSANLADAHPADAHPADAHPADVWYVPRRNWFFGREIKHCGWVPDYRQPQLFRKGALLFSDADEVHEGFRTVGTIGYLKSAIWQIPYRDLSQLVHKMQRYSTLGANKMERGGKRPAMRQAFLHGLGAFLRIWILKGGILDGWAGFIIALGNFEGTFYRYAKLHEEQQGWNQPPEHLR